MFNCKDKLKEILGEGKNILALSGGVDSISLYHMLKETYEEMEKPLSDLICVHYNHNLREESSTEFTAIEEMVEKDGAVFEGISLDVYSYCSENKLSMETGARELRYKGFEMVSKEYDAKNVFLGHHGDDLVETVMMRMVSGSHGRGLVGMTEKVNHNDVTYLRPLLATTKDDLYVYAKKNNLVYFEDISNKDEAITRNRYRKNLLPFIKQEKHNVHETFKVFSEEKEEDEQFFDLFITKFFTENVEKCSLNGVTALKFNIKEFLNLHISLKKRVFKSMLNAIDEKSLVSQNRLKEFEGQLASKKLVVLNKQVSYYRENTNIGVLISREEFTEHLASFTENESDKVKLKGSLRCKCGGKLEKKYTKYNIEPALREYSYVELDNNEVVKVITPFKEVEII